MMQLTIRGDLFNREQKKLIRDLTIWCGNKLLGPRLSKNIRLGIRITGPDLHVKTQMYGYTDVMDPDSGKPPREFKITITSKFEILRSLMIISHEMVHVKQYARRELGWCGRTWDQKWQGSRFDVESSDYWDLPWEIEAHGREKGLVIQWAEETGHDRSKWFRGIF